MYTSVQTPWRLTILGHQLPRTGQNTLPFHNLRVTIAPFPPGPCYIPQYAYAFLNFPYLNAALLTAPRTTAPSTRAFTFTAPHQPPAPCRLPAGGASTARRLPRARRTDGCHGHTLPAAFATLYHHTATPCYTAWRWCQHRLLVPCLHVLAPTVYLDAITYRGRAIRALCPTAAAPGHERLALPLLARMPAIIVIPQ